MNYTEALVASESLWSSKKDNHPCLHGKARCCRDTNIQLCEGDKENIEYGLESGLIAQEVLLEAKANQDDGQEMCAFLNRRSKRCMIYAMRPLICRGTGGIFTLGCKEKEESTAVILHVDEIPHIPVEEAGNTMCSHCHDKFRAQNKGGFISKETITVSAWVLEHIVMNFRTTMGDFVRDIPVNKT